MKHVLILCAALLVTACGPKVVMQRNFPAVPDELMAPCPDLIQTPEGTDKLSSIVDVVADNYGLYYKCQDRNGKWIKWYTEQKKIFESVK